MNKPLVISLQCKYLNNCKKRKYYCPNMLSSSFGLKEMVCMYDFYYSVSVVHKPYFFPRTIILHVYFVLSFSLDIYQIVK